MADVRPLRALRYDPERAGAPLQDLVAPPYDVIDAEQRNALEARSPHNVVAIDLPQGDDPYATAAETFARWRAEGVLAQDEEPAFWVLAQDYVGPDGRGRTRTGIFGRVRVEPYGAGRVRPHERTHPGPKQDRLELTRATTANLSPIFVLHDDPDETVAAAIAPTLEHPPDAETTDADGTRNRLWRVADPTAADAITQALEPAELLIADGHHRYETARIYADEVGDQDGAHRYVLACLVALQDPGLTVFPTHRLLTRLAPEAPEALRTAIQRDWDYEELEDLDGLEPPAQTGDAIVLGYLDAHFRRPFRLTLKDAAIADAALEDHSPAYRRLDTAVLEALILKGALHFTDEDIDHKDGLDYSRTTDEARDLVLSGEAQAAFFTGAVPVALIRDVAAAGEVMPPKSTFFHPKVPTGLVFNRLDEE